MKKIIITGAGGFIGCHLTRYLKKKGYFVTGIDLKKPMYAPSDADIFIIADLRKIQSQKYFINCDELYMLAADMGGVGYLSNFAADVMKNNSLININCLEGAKKNKIPKVFFASSACVYPQYKQENSIQKGLKETEVMPADPDKGYGWEKLYTEQLCSAYSKEFKMNIKIARFHNIYGPEGEYKGGKEKSPAAICRKVSEALDKGIIEIWGDGKQSRSYCFVEDCCEGIYRLMKSNHSGPINIGSDNIMSIDELTDIVIQISGKSLTKKYNLQKPQGVRGRNSDNTYIKNILKWKPSTPIKKGIKSTYLWIDKQVHSV